MSAGAGRREVAYRVFAAEYDDADLSYSESDEERAPNYVVTPTGARVNRLFLVGVLTEVESVNEDMLRGRVVDPTGAFVVYAGQYQPDELAFLERAEPPAFVAVTGKARTFQPEDSDRVYTSVRPESISEVDAETRDRWVVNAAERTVERVATMASAMVSDLSGDDLRATLEAAGVDEGLAAGIPRALEHYGTTPTYLQAVRETALDAARVVADEREEVEPLSVAPDATGEARAADLADPDLVLEAPDDAGGAEPAEDGDDAFEADAEDASAPADPSDSDAGRTEPTPDADTSDAEPAVDEGADESGTTASTASTTAEAKSADEESDEELGSGADTGEGASAQQDADDELGDFEGGDFDLDEETRQEVEEEHGVEFSSGNEVEPAEELESPEPDEPAGADEEPTDGTGDAEGEPDGDDESTGSEAATDAEDVDLEDAAMEAMADLDDGDGAERSAVIDRVVEETGAAPGDVEDAIQDALMSGRCYEPDGDRLKPI